MWWYGPGMGGWAFGLMTVSAVLFWALIILGLIALVRHLRTGSNGALQAWPAPEELLAERFARGEIDEQEYRRRLDALHGGSSPLTKS